MKKILLAIDDSEESKKAVSKVAEVAGLLEAEVTLLTVIKEIKVSSGAPSVPRTTPSQGSPRSPRGSPPSSQGSIPSSGTPLQGSMTSKRKLDRIEEKTKLENEGRRILNQAEDLLQEKEINTEKVILEGRVADSICQFAKAQSFDLIALADKGRRRIAKFLLGSTCEKVLRCAPTSVLVIK
ncbi:MAG: universal stress protein [Anaerolineae bacterium]